MLVVDDDDLAASSTRAIACGAMPNLIVRHFLRDLPVAKRREVERHLAGCLRCMGRSQALAVAASHYQACLRRSLDDPWKSQTY